MLMPAVLLPVGTSRATIEMGAYAGFDFHRFDNAHGSANIETTNRTESVRSINCRRQMPLKIHAVVKQPQHVDGPIPTDSENHKVPALAARPCNM